MTDRLSALSPYSFAVLRIVSGLLFVHGGLMLLFNFPASTYPAPPAEMATLLTIAGWIDFWPANNMGVAAILYCFIFLHLVFAGAGVWSIDGRGR